MSCPVGRTLVALRLAVAASAPTPEDQRQRNGRGHPPDERVGDRFCAPVAACRVAGADGASVRVA